MKERRKKVLIISYYWPPAGGISVLRSLKISKYLLEYGWDPVVLTIDNPQYPIVDDANYNHVDPRVEVLKTGGFQPFSIYKKITKRKKNDTLANVLNANSDKTGILHNLAVWIRANFFIPDARSSWIKPAMKRASKYLRDNKIDAIFSDGPPHTNTVIAYKLSEKYNIPWLMDWQDPWTEVDYYEMFPIGRRADKKHKALEQKCLKQASAMTIVSPTWKKDAIRLGATNVDVIYWGYDNNDFEDLKKNELPKFTISHVGLLGEDRVSESFFKALGELSEEIDDFINKFELIFIGTVTNKVNQLVLENKLDKITNIKPQVPRKEALNLVLNSDINLLLLNVAHNAQGRVPGKLFEYIYANNVILNLGPVISDVNSIIEELSIGNTFEYDDKNGIKDFILNQFQLSQSNGKLIRNRNIKEYSIDNQTFKISQILDRIIE